VEDKKPFGVPGDEVFFPKRKTKKPQEREKRCWQSTAGGGALDEKSSWVIKRIIEEGIMNTITWSLPIFSCLS
jgi:hypothetical protein